MTTPTTLSHLITVKAPALDALYAAVADVNTKAAKFGLPPVEVYTVKVTEESIKRPDGCPSGATIKVYHLGLTVPSRIGLAGWSLLGVIDFVEGVAIIREVPGETVPASYRTPSIECDHCKTSRRRTNVFIVAHEDGRTARIGRSCLAAYLGVNPETILRAAAWLGEIGKLGERDWLEGGGSRIPPTFAPEWLLTLTARVVAVDGYFSRAAAENLNRPSTAALVNTFLSALLGWLPDKVTREVLADFGEVTEADRATAATVLAFATTVDGTTTWAYNLRSLASAEKIGLKHLGLLVSAHGAWKRATEEATERAAKPVSEWTGEVGERLRNLTATVVSTKAFDGNFGTTTLVVFETETGARLKWWASGAKEASFPNGAAVTLTGTVKAHEEFKGRKETVLSRVTS